MFGILGFPQSNWSRRLRLQTLTETIVLILPAFSKSESIRSLRTTGFTFSSAHQAHNRFGLLRHPAASWSPHKTLIMETILSTWS